MEAMLKWGLVLTRCSLRFEGRQREAAIHEWITFCVGSYGGEEVLFVACLRHLMLRGRKCRREEG
jgi:hypothetical protein